MADQADGWLEGCDGNCLNGRGESGFSADFNVNSKAGSKADLTMAGTRVGHGADSEAATRAG